MARRRLAEPSRHDRPRRGSRPLHRSRRGRAYVEDPLVYRGPFKGPTLEMFVAAVQQVSHGGSLGALPTLSLHGENDPLARLGPAREAVQRIRGSSMQEKVYPGAMHEILNDSNQDEVIADVVGFIAITVKGSPKPVQAG